MPSQLQHNHLKNDQQLTVFYDGHCPLCIKEIRYLDKHNTQGLLILVDIHSENFSAYYPHLDKQQLDARLHGLTADGHLITGLDVTHLAFTLIGKGWVYAPLRWPLIRIFADSVYTLFAKHRHTIARWVSGQRQSCEYKKEGNNDNK